jgi:prepilin signal peptidase PulO-like enzyme (type II secretory pathway)
MMTFIFPLYIFLFGLAIGSFLNVVIWRAKNGETILGRSHCPHCKRQIVWYDNIPLLSFILLRGRCRNCQGAISAQYPLVEFATALLFSVAFYYNFQFFPPLRDPAVAVAIFNQFSIVKILPLIRDWFLIAAMVAIFVIDLRWYLILDVISLPAAAIIFILNLLIGDPTYNLCRLENLWSCNPLSWSGLLISAVIGGSFFLLQFIVSRGRWIGGGDIRLGLLMGLALGWPQILLALMLAYFAGSIVGLGLMAIGKKQWGSMLPFGVFLAPATIATLFWGKEILHWYLNIFS